MPGPPSRRGALGPGWRRGLITLAIGAGGCGGEAGKPAGGTAVDAGDAMATHTLIYGGDVFTARRANFALQRQETRDDMFVGDLARLFRGADVAMVNNEGVIAAGGRWNRPGQASFVFRAHPIMLEVYRNAGIDLVTLGNNHAGDYGTEAMVEMLDRFNEAGIDYTGAGYDLEDAETPAFRLVGDTVVAVVSVEMTYSRKYRALADRPGSLVYPALRGETQTADAVEGLRRRLAQAREHAHVVLLSPHWDGGKRATTAEMRSLAKEVIEAGYDGILAHSHHRYLGVELIDGKPVVYDAGNLLIDYQMDNFESRGMVWEATFDRAGIRRLRGFPVRIRASLVGLAKGEVRDEILADLARLCDELGTAYEIREGVMLIEADPGEIHVPKEPVAPRRPVPAPGRIREAPRTVVLDALPSDAKPVDLRWENGIRLVGYSLVSDRLKLPVGSQVVHLYFQADAPVRENVMIHLQADYVDPRGETKMVQENHLPGDWMLPAEKWPVGKIIDDATLFRLDFDQGGTVTFSAGVRRLGEWTRSNQRGVLLEPVSADQALEEDGRFVLGTAVYSEAETRSVAQMIDDFEAARTVVVSADQPY